MEGGHTDLGIGDDIGSKRPVGSNLSDVDMVFGDDPILILLLRGGPEELS